MTYTATLEKHTTDVHPSAKLTQREPLAKISVSVRLTISNVNSRADCGD
ncbi:MAG: hypothetical protein V7L06_30955 [Nostoc sp.]